jgi:(4S)-4-hydroxy-5-phosphonooxypentane-2,3-dione isomerase
MRCMLIVHVFVRVRSEAIAGFKAATVENARQSLAEPGIARFDVIQDVTDETRFVLVEVYRDEQAPARHKETAHYAEWRDSVAEMMAEPRTSIRYTNVFPGHDGWAVGAA